MNQNVWKSKKFTENHADSWPSTLKDTEKPDIKENKSRFLECER